MTVSIPAMETTQTASLPMLTTPLKQQHGATTTNQIMNHQSDESFGRRCAECSKSPRVPRPMPVPSFVAGFICGSATEIY